MQGIEEEIDYRIEYEKLEKKYEELQDRIDKAIELFGVKKTLSSFKQKKLLEILKGEDKE